MMPIVVDLKLVRDCLARASSYPVTDTQARSYLDDAGITEVDGAWKCGDVRAANLWLSEIDYPLDLVK